METLVLLDMGELGGVIFARRFRMASGWDALATMVSDPLLDQVVRAAFLATNKDWT